MWAKNIKYYIQKDSYFLSKMNEYTWIYLKDRALYADKFYLHFQKETTKPIEYAYLEYELLVVCYS